MKCDCGTEIDSDGVCVSYKHGIKDIKMKQLISLAGKMGCGKDTAADYLVNNYGFAKISFADNLKRAAMKSFGLTHDQCYDRTKKELPFVGQMPLNQDAIDRLMEFMREENGYNMTPEMESALYAYVGKVTFGSPREVLQFYGTELMRNIVSASYHADVVKYLIDKNGWDKVVIADSRFKNEREAVSNWGGKNVLLTRPQEVNVADTSTGIKGHASEGSLGNPEEYDYILENNLSLAHLYAEIAGVLRLSYPNEYLNEENSQVIPEGVRFEYDKEDNKVFMFIKSDELSEELEFTVTDGLVNSLISTVKKITPLKDGLVEINS